MLRLAAAADRAATAPVAACVAAAGAGRYGSRSPCLAALVMRPGRRGLIRVPTMLPAGYSPEPFAPIPGREPVTVSAEVAVQVTVHVAMPPRTGSV